MRLDLSNMPDVSATLDDSQRRIVEEHVRDELRRMREDPLRYGVPPHVGQEEMHCAEGQHTLLISANRWGKSWALMREALWRATHTHPYRRLRPHNVIWLGFPDFPFYLKVTKRIFDAWCPKKYLLQFHESEKWAKFRRSDGGECTIFFLSYDSGREKWQGGAVDFVGLDEEHPEDIYNEATARLIDTRGHMLQTLTPVSGMGWIYDRVYLPALRKEKPIQLVQGALAEYDDSKPLGVGEILVPHLDYDQVMRFANEIPDEDERAIRIFGQFRARSGLVYKQYRQDIHRVPAFEIPRHWYVWGAVDPGYHGFAVTVYAQSPAGRVYVIAEFYSQEEVTSKRFAAVQALYESIWPPEEGTDPGTIVFFVDTEDPQLVLEMNTQAAKEEVSLAFASLDQGLKAVKAGLLRVQQMLQPKKTLRTPAEVDRPRAGDGEPVLYFFDTLASTWRDGETAHTNTSRLLWELSRYLWKKPKQQGQTQTDEPDKNSAGGAHMLDTLRYGVMARMGAPEPLKEEKYAAAGEDAWVWEHLDELEAEMLAEDAA